MTEVCTNCSTSGTAVPINLVRFQVVKSWRRDLEGKEFSFCESPGCSVVYFSVDGAVFTTEDIRRAPAYKTEEGHDLLCFCFEVTGDDAMSPDATPYVRERVRKSECACNVLNPSGGCCLGSIGRWQKEHRKAGEGVP